ncbi:MAG: PQQ-binding-like beta-propeller repeat protein [Phycisphaerae bacterium]|nr:PQQ-binding-like beta-propeller repeat protein [Phycisphaerae bacterium]
MNYRVLTTGLMVLLGLQAGIRAAEGEAIAEDNALRQAGLTCYWEAKLPFQRGDSAVSAHLLDDTLYVSTRLGDLHAVDSQVGLLRWAHSVARRGRRVFKPFHLHTAQGKGAVLAAHSDGAYVYNRHSGEVLAKMSGMWPAGSAAVGNSLLLFAGSSDGHLYAVRWHDPVNGVPIRIWKVLGGGPVTSAPLLIDDVVYFASQGGTVFACTADWHKTLKWYHATEAAVVADLYADESGVYVAGLDRSLYRLDLNTGRQIWRYRLPQALRDAPITSQRTVYQHCKGCGLYAIDVDTGELLWSQADATAFVSRRADRTCVALGDDRVALLDSSTAKVQSVIPLSSKCLAAPNPDSLTFYLVTPGGRVGCFASSDVRHLRVDDILKGLTPPGEGDSTEEEEENKESGADHKTANNAEPDMDDPLRSGWDR